MASSDGEELVSYPADSDSPRSERRPLIPDESKGDEHSCPNISPRKFLQRLWTCGGRRKGKVESLQKLHTIIIQGENNGFASNRISTRKYNIITFVPKFLFDQFRRFANLFFLLIVLLQQIPGISPTGRYTTAVPLAIVLTVAAIKELTEDVIRFRADNAINKRVVEVLKRGNIIDEARWKDVKVGEIVRVANNSFFPADLVLLHSSDPTGRCYIETANLDGETNLKVRETHLLMTDYEERDLEGLEGTVECEEPNKKLYEFTGNLILTGKEKEAIVPDNILLRDAQLRNTDYVYGLVVYTGRDSKIMQNARAVPLKRSNMDHATNRQIILMVFVLVALSLASAIGSIFWNLDEGNSHWYLQLHIHNEEKAAGSFFFSSLTFLILYNNLIPISLIVSQEVARVIQAYLINMDLNIYDEVTDTPTRARNSNLNEELGQVQYVFSDKTGTLTQNIMKFKKCSIKGELYKMDSQNNQDKTAEPLSKPIRRSHVLYFLKVLALCHSVVPEYDEVDEKLYYRSVSPDEEALVEAAREMGVVFKSSQNRTMKIKVQDEEEEYTLLNVLEFSSARKRMSVIVKTPDGEIKLLCKGADNVIYDRLASSDPLSSITQQHLDMYANEGLRTLCVAEANLDEDRYKAWNAKYHEAITATEDREARVEQVAELIEKDLHLLGATAIEDKLQEEVPETIEKLRQAGMKVWVLTGDKMETAINIGYSSKQLTDRMKILRFTQRTEQAIIEKIDEELKELEDKKHEDVATVIDGKALSLIFRSESDDQPSNANAQKFLQLCLRCQSVICCRTTPSQKAEVVELVKHKLKGTITLAIGDGANDVSMIQAAHIGVGISGREGLQATLASDYSIAQFRFLGTLLLVHGAWNYQRMAKLIVFSFYKNICLYIIEFWYTFQSGYSGQAIFQRWTIATFNLLFTGVTPFIFALFDQDVSADTRRKKPHLYSKGERFNLRMFWSWVLLSIIHSVILYYVTFAAIPTGTSLSNGKNTDLLYAGNTIYTATVITVNVLVGIISSQWTIISHVFIWGSIAFWLIFILPYSFLWPTFPIASDMFGSALILYNSLMFYALGIVLIPSMTLLPVLLYLGIQHEFFPSAITIARDEELAEKCKCSCRHHQKYSIQNIPMEDFSKQ